MNTDLPESSAPMLKSLTIFKRPYVKSSALPTLNQRIVNQTDVTLDMDTDPPESSALMIYSDLMIVDWEDIFCSRPRYGGQDWHDMIDTDSSDPDVRKRMDTADLVCVCRTVAQDHRWSDTDDNSDADSVTELEYSAWDDACAGEFQNTLGNIPPGLFQNPPTYKIQDCEMDDNSDTDSIAELEHIAWDDACAGEFQNMLGNIPPGLVQNPQTDKIRNYETNDISDTDSVAELNYSAWDDACAGDYQNMLGNIQNPPTYKIQNDDTDHGSDDSVAELEYTTWEDACAWRCRSVLVNIPPGLVQNPPTGHIRHYETDDGSDTDSVAELECKTGEANVPPGLVQNSPTDIL